MAALVVDTALASVIVMAAESLVANVALIDRAEASATLTAAASLTTTGL